MSSTLYQNSCICSVRHFDARDFLMDLQASTPCLVGFSELVPRTDLMGANGQVDCTQKASRRLHFHLVGSHHSTDRTFEASSSLNLLGVGSPRHH